MPNPPNPHHSNLVEGDAAIDEREFLEKRHSGYRLKESDDKAWPVNRVGWEPLQNERGAEPPPAPLRPPPQQTPTEPRALWFSRWANEIAFIVVTVSIVILIAVIVKTMFQ